MVFTSRQWHSGDDVYATDMQAINDAIVDLYAQLAAQATASAASGGGTTSTITTPPTTTTTSSSVATTTAYPADNGVFIADPGMGYQPYTYATASYPTSVEFRRSNAVNQGNFDWADMNPANGTYDFSNIETFLNSCQARGQRGAFAITTMGGTGYGGATVPSWAAVPILSNGEPEYDSYAYQYNWTQFVDKLAATYDGDPRISYIRITGYGQFNEWQSYPNTDFSVEDPTQPVTTVDGQCRRHLIHAFVGGTGTIPTWTSAANGGTTALTYTHTGFQKTQLIMPYGGMWNTSRYVLANYPKVGFSNDALGMPNNGTLAAYKQIGYGIDTLWQRAPVTFEPVSGWQDSYAVDGKAALQGLGAVFIHDNSLPVDATTQDMIRLVGYRYVCTAITVPQAANPGDTISIPSTWTNNGYSKAYKSLGTDLAVAIAVINSSGTVSAAFTTGHNLSDTLLPGTPLSIVDSIHLPSTLANGSYTLHVGVVEQISNTRITLPLNTTRTDNWYPVASINIGTVTGGGSGTSGSTTTTGTAQTTFWAIGDSETAGNEDSTGYSYPGLLANSIGSGVTVYNDGKPGWTSTEIAIRTGAVNVLVNAFTIPTSTVETTLTIQSPTQDYRADGTGGYWSWQGTLAGVTGVLRHYSDTDGHWSFRALTAPTSAVSVAAGSQFHCTEDDGFRGYCALIMVGRNNLDQPQVLSDVSAIISRLTTTNYLVISILNSSSEGSGTANYSSIVSINNALKAAYGSKYVDAREYMVQNGLSYNGLTPTSADTTAINSDAMPPSLLWSGDNFHPNQYGYRALAKGVLTQLLALGYVAAGAAQPNNPPLNTSTNLYTDPSFELNTATFSTSQAGAELTFARSTAAAHTGTYGVRGSFTGANTGARFQFSQAINPATSHSGAVYVRPSKQVVLSAALLYFNAGTYLGGYYPPGDIICPANVWTKIFVSGPAGMTGDTLYLIGYNDGQAWASGDTVDFDDVSIVAGSATP